MLRSLGTAPHPPGGRPRTLFFFDVGGEVWLCGPRMLTRPPLLCLNPLCHRRLAVHLICLVVLHRRTAPLLRCTRDLYHCRSRQFVVVVDFGLAVVDFGLVPVVVEFDCDVVSTVIRIQPGQTEILGLLLEVNSFFLY